MTGAVICRFDGAQWVASFDTDAGVAFAGDLLVVAIRRLLEAPADGYTLICDRGRGSSSFRRRGMGEIVAFSDFIRNASWNVFRLRSMLIQRYLKLIGSFLRGAGHGISCDRAVWARLGR